MNSNYSRLSLLLGSSLAPLMILLAGLAGETASAQEMDRIGIYFDPAYTQYEFNTGTLPAVVPAYLVLHNPSAPGGVGGWECRLKIEGPGRLASTELEGAAINVQDPPDFMVGIGDAPLPGGDQVLLATFNILVEKSDPVIVSLLPLYRSSIPDQMAYLSTDGSEGLLPMATVTSDPKVAFINASAEPICALTPDFLSFPNTFMGEPSSQSFTIVNPGILPLELNLAFSGDCPDFALEDVPEGPLTVQPRSSRTITVSFDPTEPGYKYCYLLLGSTCPNIRVYGVGEGAITSWIAPTELNFGEIPIETSKPLSFYVHNTGETTFTVQLSLDASCVGFTTNTTSEYTLLPGSSRNFAVTFSPSESEPYACTLDMGETIPAIPLIGFCAEDINLQITPATLEFPTTTVGYSYMIAVVVANIGNTQILIDPVFTPADGVFSVAPEDFPLEIVPRVPRTIVAVFTPRVAGSYEAVLSFGEDLPVVPITGTSVEPVFDCAVSPALVDFGSVTVGQSETRSFQVTNQGSVPLVILPEETSSGFTVETGPINISPGTTKDILVTFRPLSDDIWVTEITLGQDYCSTVVCTGTGVPLPSSNENLVGFTFYPASLGYSDFEHSIFAAQGSVVTAYLAMVNPTSSDPFAGWECCVSLEGPGTFISWEMDGLPINVLTEPCFMVGLGTPFPPAPYYILAMTQIFVSSNVADIILRMDPIYYASIPGEMAWLTGGAVPQLIPMNTHSGIPEVALIKTNETSELVGVAAPMPTAEVTGGRVELSWTLPSGENHEFDGCRLYRGVEPGSAQPLNQQLLPITDRTFTFTDHPTGFEPGTVLYYSYALVRDGVEQARSPEVEVTLKSLPPMVTRLLPNVPNPFNPQTEIRFELEQAGPARVTIYDVQGRLVRTLVNEGLDVGPHSHTWFGKDDHGRQASSGAYYIRLETEGRLDHRKVMLLK